MSDQYLILKCIEQDRKSQKILFERYAPYLLSVAQRYINDYQEAEDVFLKGFEKIFKYLPTYKEEKGQFKYWAKRFIINEALNLIRIKKNYFIVEDLSIYEHTNMEENIISKLNVEELHKTISELRPPFGVIFNMVIDGYSYAEISTTLTINEVTCRSYYMRSKAMLRDILFKTEYVHNETK